MDMKTKTHWWTVLNEARGYLSDAEDYFKAHQPETAKKYIYEAYRELEIAFLEDQQTREVE